VSAAPPTIGGCQVFPADNIWNTTVDDMPVDRNSEAYVASIGASEALHPDFGAGLHDGAPIGIPFVVVPFEQPKVEIAFTPFGTEEPIPEESDPGPYPIPPDAPIEGGPDSLGDRHVIVVQEGSCTLHELYRAEPLPDGGWRAISAAKFDLESNELRIEGHTSADAAGLPIFPGLVRYDEVASGEISHALRFTAPVTRRQYVWPARHFASGQGDVTLPPMGQRFRLKADFDISGFSPQNQVILRALKTYGMILADNGAPWFVTGTPDDRWTDADLDQLKALTGSDFEAVDTSGLMLFPDSGAAAL
jgi:hypothetical protein